ncbi:mycothiol synthase [Galbitalea sp. SE-J8]|uniref:mycothiol synthase n=1 Tax=Galbitalea sp. SE-J8 TaxID=3054952 RepID=UPI00259CBDB1|nr:mycothiol synthase [Galbitalea sp. SE-J8]MDM4763771.1 mycothiol synthase [Galbitalea sp. SE-J8]
MPELIGAARAADGHPPFSDRALVDLRTGAKQLVTIDDVAAAIVSDTEAELVVHPDARRRGYGTELVETVLTDAAPGLLAWAHGDGAAARALAERFGFEPVRRLLLLTAQVPDASPAPRGAAPAGVTIRAFRPERDADAWVALNARAFAAHPEQGRVTRADLAELEAEPWFDASAFLLAWRGRTLVGYCWLKLGDDDGEIYVLGVAPEEQGAGLGRALLAAGLDELARRGIRSSSLYVEADNAVALALYERAGFRETSADVQYRWRPGARIGA